MNRFRSWLSFQFFLLSAALVPKGCVMDLSEDEDGSSITFRIIPVNPPPSGPAPTELLQ